MTKLAHFIHVKSTYSAKDYARIFINTTICHHGISLTIITDRGVKFTSRFCRSFQEGLGTKVKLSTAFNPKTDGQAKRTVQTIEDMLRACIIDLKGNWDKHSYLVIFLGITVSIRPYPRLLMKPCMVGGLGVLWIVSSR